VRLLGRRLLARHPASVLGPERRHLIPGLILRLRRLRERLPHRERLPRVELALRCVFRPAGGLGFVRGLLGDSWPCLSRLRLSGLGLGGLLNALICISGPGRLIGRGWLIGWSCGWLISCGWALRSDCRCHTALRVEGIP
jgi:hypothetical protein